MKRIGLLFFILVVPFLITDNVFADFKENAFTDEECLVSNDWQKDVRTSYKVNQTSQRFELSGDTYLNGLNKNVFYDVSDDGYVLMAYVPKYNETISNGNIKDDLYNAGIITTYDCDYTLVVKKTLIGDKTLKTEVKSISVPDTSSLVNITLVVLGVSFVLISLYFILLKIGVIKNPVIKNKNSKEVNHDKK